MSVGYFSKNQEREVIARKVRERWAAGDVGGSLDIYLANYELLAPVADQAPAVVAAAKRWAEDRYQYRQSVKGQSWVRVPVKDLNDLYEFVRAMAVRGAGTGVWGGAVDT